MVGLGDLPGGIFDSEANAVSADGSVVVGTGGSASGSEAFRWTPSGGMVGLGALAVGLNSGGHAVSADGLVVVGDAQSAYGTEAFRWTVSDGMGGLGDLPGGPTSSNAGAVSADGSVMVGWSISALGTEAFRWTALGGMIGLGDLPGEPFESKGKAVSSDGSVVVGRATAASGYEAFVWDATNGMRNLKDVLTSDLGLDLTEWTLTHAEGISADGRTIVGYGSNPSGDTEAWLAYLDDTVYWYPDAGGAWAAAGNWTGPRAPTAGFHAVVAPAVPAVVTGPTSAATAKSLTIGGGAGAATLQSNAGGNLTVLETLTLEANGTLTHERGTLSADAVVNNGSLSVAADVSVTNALVNNDSLDVLAGGDLSAGSGLVNNGQLTVTGGVLALGSGLLNSGQLTLSGGTIQGGALTSDFGAQAYAHGTIDAPLNNNGSLELTGVLTVTGWLVTNQGRIHIEAAENLKQTAGLSNHGIIELAGGAISGGGTVTNHSDGVIQGDGAVRAAFMNGGLMLADGTSLMVVADFVNHGRIVLAGAGARISGGELFNNGIISGQGIVSNLLDNEGVVQAEGGSLTLSDLDVHNGPGGLIEVFDGATVFVPLGLGPNEGAIVLRGGGFHKGNRAMTNTATGAITGHGVFRGGTLTNDGHVGVGMGDLEVIAPVVHNGSFDVQAGATAVFYRDVSGPGSFTGPGTVMFLADYSPGASPASVTFGGSVTFGPAATLIVELGGYDMAGECDSMAVAEELVLGGALDVRLTGGFLPLPGDSFEILTCGRRAGEFAAATGLDHVGGHAGLELRLGYHPAGATLVAWAMGGDANLDAYVDDNDLAVMLANWTPTGPATWQLGDFTGDTLINDDDLAVLLGNWTGPPPGGAAIPEPATLALLALGGLAATRRRRPGVCGRRGAEQESGDSV